MAERKEKKNQFNFSIIMKVPEARLCVFILGLNNCAEEHQGFATSVAHTASCVNSKPLQVSRGLQCNLSLKDSSGRLHAGLLCPQPKTLLRGSPGVFIKTHSLLSISGVRAPTFSWKRKSKAFAFRGLVPAVLCTQMLSSRRMRNHYQKPSFPSVPSPERSQLHP